MKKITALSGYTDEDGNTIESPSVFDENIDITIRGKNNRIVIDENARIKKLKLVMDCDNGTLVIGPSRKKPMEMNIRVGEDATVKIGANVTTTSMPLISAVEGVTVSIGDDVMIASQNQFRADDGHPIFDVATGKRVNPAKDITIGNHVWIGAKATLLGGAKIGDGSVIGFGSIVTKRIPNNVIAVGTPAKVVRKNIAWERPHLSYAAPPYKPDASTVKKSEKYWNETVDIDEKPALTTRRTLVDRVMGKFGFKRI